jgi:hypothetical protein
MTTTTNQEDTMTTHPPCAYCAQPLSDNERDSETGGLYSAHYGAA